MTTNSHDKGSCVRHNSVKEYFIANGIRKKKKKMSPVEIDKEVA